MAALIGQENEDEKLKKLMAPYQPPETPPLKPIPTAPPPAGVSPTLAAVAASPGTPPDQRKPYVDEPPPAPPVPVPAAPAAPVVGPDISRTSGSQSGRSETYQTQTEGEKEALKKQDAAIGAQIDTAEKAKGIAVDKAGAENVQNQTEYQQLDDLQAKQEAQRRVATEKWEAANAHLDQVRADLEKKPLKDFFDDKEASGGGFGRVVAALSVGLGTFAASVGGGTNQALEIINAKIDRYGKMQRDKRAEAVGLAKDATDSARTRLEVADIEARNEKIALIDKMAAQRRAILGKFGADEKGIEGDAIINGLAQRRADLQVENEKSLRHQVNQYAQRSTSTTVDNKRMNDAALAGAVNAQGNVVYGNDGKALFQTGTPKEAEEAKDKIAATRQILSLVDQMQKSFKEHGSENPLSSERDNRNRIVAQMALALKNAEKTGALDQGTIDIVKDMVPNGPGLMGGGAKALEGFRQSVIDAASKNLDKYGVPGRQVLTRVMTDDGAAGPGAGFTVLPNGMRARPLPGGRWLVEK